MAPPTYPASKIELWPIDKLRPNPRNARKPEGYTEAPVIVARGWSAAQCRAYGITIA